MFKNYFEITTSAERERMRKAGQTVESLTFLSDKPGIPEYLKKFMKKFEETNSMDYFKEKFNKFYINEIKEQPSKIVLTSTIFCSGEANESIHHDIIAKIVYEGLIELTEEIFNIWFKKMPTNFICLTQDRRNNNSWYLSESYIPKILKQIYDNQNNFAISRWEEILKTIDKNFEINFEMWNENE